MTFAKERERRPSRMNGISQPVIVARDERNDLISCSSSNTVRDCRYNKEQVATAEGTDRFDSRSRFVLDAMVTEI